MIEVRTIARERTARQIRFPDIARTPDGTLVAVYHAAADHGGVKGVIRLLTSTDDGATWMAPRTPFRRRYDARDPKLTALADGTLVLVWFESEWSGRGWEHERLGPYAARSTDLGASWSRPRPIGSRLIEAGGWAALHGPPVELPDSVVLQPLYGQWHQPDEGPDEWVATVARSADGGRTFPAGAEVVIAAARGHRYCEPNVSVLPDGSLVALVRVDAPGHEAHLVRSTDRGGTWTEPEPTRIPARSHHQLLTTDGQLLLTYGDETNPDRPTVAALIPDPAGAWDGRHGVTIYDAGHRDQANPSSVELGDGRFLTLGYDVARRALVQITYEAADLTG